MKLGTLKTAIRESNQAPRIRTEFLGQHVDLVLQKTPLLEELDRIYPDGRSQETGLWLREDGHIMKETER